MEKLEIKKKGRILYLLRLLYHTDNEHPLSMRDIINWFAEREISVNRRTISLDIDLLKSAGYDIVVDRHSANAYYMQNNLLSQTDIDTLKTIVETADIPEETKMRFRTFLLSSTAR